MADLFVSYKREDATRVRKLVAALRETGLDVWWDEDIPASAPWEATIERALADARAVIVCWSPDAIASDNVRSEARVAREDGRLIQVFLKPCTPPLFFGERQGIDLANWRGKADDPRIGSLAETVRKVAAGERLEGEAPKPRAGLTARVAAAAAALLVLVGAAAGWWFMSPAHASGPTTVAVLPFRAFDPADQNLVDAIWDDTRGAISRNPNLRVLGRSAVEALARKGLEPRDYRRKVGAEYLLDGGVQRVGERVEIKVSLVRTDDGAEVWSDRIGGKLDDVFAFQTRIASEVEGRIRGRVAPGGGRKIQNIATSGEVYGIFADARANIRKRDPDGLARGIELLNKALSLDPNYAPAWAELGIATAVLRPSGMLTDATEAKSVGYLRHALDLAPNLAHAHAALAMVQSFPVSAQADLEKAVELDPSDAEAWMWLGNSYGFQNRLKDALAAHSRAVEIEPLWFQAVANKMGDLVQLGDSGGMDAELRRVAETGDDILLTKIKIMLARTQQREGEAIVLLTELRDKHAEQASFVSRQIVELLLTLGYVDDAARVDQMPADVAATYKGTLPSAAQLDARYKRPLDLWVDEDAPARLGRLFAKNGRTAEYISRYKAAFRGPDDFADAYSTRPHVLTILAPTVAALLRAGGEPDQAAAIMRRAESVMAPWLKNGPPDGDLLATLAMARAAEGRDEEALQLLARAVSRGWLPDGAFWARDIADEPSFDRLRQRAEFQAARRRIWERVQRQRQIVRPVELALAA
jgi:TolB-like protein/tetratricopeptide (TPR) repeat protein